MTLEHLLLQYIAAAAEDSWSSYENNKHTFEVWAYLKNMERACSALRHKPFYSCEVSA